MLDQYVHTGVSELDDDKLPEIIELKYKAIADAKSKLGSISSIRDTFLPGCSINPKNWDKLTL